MIKDFNVLLIEDNLIEMMKIKKLLSLLKLDHNISFANNV
jgi:hypothetical protein